MTPQGGDAAGGDGRHEATPAGKDISAPTMSSFRFFGVGLVYFCMLGVFEGRNKIVGCCFMVYVFPFEYVA